MYNDKKILAIIPARGGSKGLPGKNIKPLCGKPLIVWAIDTLKASKYVDRVFVSTDTQEIAQIARNHGVEIPFLRSEELAGDRSLVIDSVIETIHHFENRKEIYDIILLIEPTSPLRTTELIDSCIEELAEKPNGSIATFTEIEVPIERIWIIEGEKAETYLKNDKAFRPRQELTKGYKLNGLLYGIKKRELLTQKSIMTPDVIPYLTSREMSVDIDDINDFNYIEYLIQQNAK